MAMTSTSAALEAQLGPYKALVNKLVDKTVKDEQKLMAAQELSDKYEKIIFTPLLQPFVDYALKIFMQILTEGEIHFIAEYHINGMRRLILEMIWRIPSSKHLKPYVEQLMAQSFKLMLIENETNVLLSLRILIEMHKHYRPAFTPEVTLFLQAVKSVYKDLPDHVNTIFEPVRNPVQVSSLDDIKLIPQFYIQIPVVVVKRNPEGGPVIRKSYTLLPRGLHSLKVLQELPIVIVLMYELYKDVVRKEVDEYIPIIIKAITLQPLKQHRLDPLFNKEILVEFMTAQIKTLSLLAYIVRMFEEVVGKYSTQMVEGILGMLTLCPKESTTIRKELLIATRHICSSKLKIKPKDEDGGKIFIPYMERLLDEDTLLGRGWTTNESLRPLAFSTLADLVHHVRHHLPMSDLAKAVHLFSKNVHDDTLPMTVQTVSCKLLLNLVDCIKAQSEKDPTQLQVAQDLLWKMLEVFVLRFKTIGKLQLPYLMKCRQAELQKTNNNTASSQLPYYPLLPTPTATPNSTPASTRPPTPASNAPSLAPSSMNAGAIGPSQISAPPAIAPPSLPPPSNISLFSSSVQIKKEEAELAETKADEKDLARLKSNLHAFTFSDIRSLVKTLVCGVKTITWRFKALKMTLKFKETDIFIRLVKWALLSLDVYILTINPNQPLGAAAVTRNLAQQTVRTKEEKEVLEHFSGVFFIMDAPVFREIFSTTIDFMVERIANNFALQIVGNSFLSNPNMSPVFATVLVEYLLGRMEVMGSGDMERSALYLKLFKLVFGSVSLFAAENEHMLRPHLHEIVNRSMELATSAKEPYNYFLLLRTLFRSIGGGNHDLLYMEFLPLLPNLLQGLNSLQAGLHKQPMKDLFVELCLTVPVRLSSLLPYLPMLMDPLVSALNGSSTLISQGLRTLELCVDNLQPDFLYEHIQPVRAELMQALWKCLRNPTDQVAHVAFRVLGKFGGGNRKMMTEPQKLEYRETDDPGPCIVIQFPDHTDHVFLPVMKIIDHAVDVMRPPHSEVSISYRQMAWGIIRDYILASIKFDDDRKLLKKFMSYLSLKGVNENVSLGQPYKCPDNQARQTQVNAFTGMFYAMTLKEMTPEVEPIFDAVVRHYTIVAIAQFSGYFTTSVEQNCLDTLVLIDALSVIMGHEEKELCKIGRVVMEIIVKTAETIFCDLDVACRLPLFEYISESMCSLCYDRGWYTKLGGCLGIQNLYEMMSMRWIYQHMYIFVKAQLFVIMDLTSEVSSGAIDQAKKNMENLVRLCAKKLDNEETAHELKQFQTKALADVSFELIRQVTSPTDLIREQSMHLLHVFAEVQNKTVVEVMLPHKDVLADMIPPKKHLLRHQSANAQIGLMEGNTFCTTLTPRLFTIDLKVMEHKVFYHEVLSLCEAQDQALMKMPCYKTVGSLIPLRKAAMRALAACHYIPGCTEKIFNILYQSLERPQPELQEAAFQCMKTFVAGATIDMNMVHEVMKPLLSTLGDHRNLNIVGARRLSYLVQLFPTSFNEKLCEQLLHHLQTLLEKLINNITQPTSGNVTKGLSKHGESEQVIVTLINIFHEIPAAGARFIEPMSTLILQTERNLVICTSSPFRLPLIKFLLCYPSQTINFLLSHIKEDIWSKFLEYIIRHDQGKPFREVLQTSCVVDKLISMALAGTACDNVVLNDEKYELQYQSIKIIRLLVKYDHQWISTQHHLAKTLLHLWSSDPYLNRHSNLDCVNHAHWQEPKLLLKTLLTYFSHHPNNFDVLFQLVKVFTVRILPQFQFFRTFLDSIVAQSYTVEWKRKAFFRFVELFPLHPTTSKTALTNEMKAKVLQMIIMPCFTVCFERGETYKLIGRPPDPQDESPDNIVYIFITKLLEPDAAFGHGEAVRIMLLQMCSLFVDHALAYIHDPSNQLLKLRRIMTYTWPCLTGGICTDGATKFYGHLLLANIISKIKLPATAYKKVVLQVLRDLLRGFAVEVRPLVRQACELLIPAIISRMDEGHRMLIYWTRKTMIEEGNLIQQLYHLLQLIVRHYAVYYPVRHQIVPIMINALSKISFSSSSTIEHRRLGCEIAECLVRWEVQRVKDEAANQQDSPYPGSVRRAPDEETEQPRKKGPAASPLMPPSEEDENAEMKPLDKTQAESLINYLMKIACSVNDSTPVVAGVAGHNEALSRRCYNLIRTALKPEVWPNYTIDFRFPWLEKLLSSVDTAEQNLASVCVALELFTLILPSMKKEQILSTCKAFQKGINACISSTNSKIIRLTHGFLARLMNLFPTEPSHSNTSAKQEELECIYSSVGRVIFEGLSNYETNTSATSGSLFGTVMMLKAACSNNPSYVDRLITPFVRVIHRMCREHLTATATDTTPATSDLLILSLDLVKNRIAAMNSDTKKTFIGAILVGLIEKSSDIKVMKAVCKMVEEWVKCNRPLSGPSLREKSILLVKLMQFVEKKFPDLHTQFLELVHYVYSDESLRTTELISKLESAFLSGLRSTNPEIRARFFDIFDSSIRRRLHDRLMYIVSSQNWEPMGQHYWIKQCLELILVTADDNFYTQLSPETPLLEGIFGVIEQANTVDRENFDNFLYIKQEAIESDSVELVVDSVEYYVIQNFRLVEMQKQRVKSFLNYLIQLCHDDIPLAERVWIDLFPRLWSILSERQKTSLTGEMLPFLVSGTHVNQKEIHPSSISTLYEGLAHCNPPIEVKPMVMAYLGKSHNLWHRVTLALEKVVADQNSAATQNKIKKELECYDFEPDVTPEQKAIEQLEDMYYVLGEEDMWCSLWQKNARYKETCIALAYENQGFYEQALGAWELALGKGKSEFSTNPAPFTLAQEQKLWERQWIRCSRELAQYEHLLDYAKTKGHVNPNLILECAWRVPDWKLMKDALASVETCCPKENQWKIHLYHGFLTICHPEEQHLPIVERYVELASSLCMREWKRLPHIVSHIHLPYLQAAQQIMELHEACQIHQGLLHERPNSLHDMKAIVKTWRNRLPIIADDPSHWSDIFTWRQHHYQFITAHYDSQHESGSTHSTFGVHASAQTIIHFGKIARKQNLTSVCMDSLSRIYTIPYVPIVDCFQKIRQQVKCYVQVAQQTGHEELKQGLEVVESTNLKYFSKEMTAEFYAIKGMLLSQLGRHEDAYKAFSAAVQFHDTLVKGWALWGDFIESQFSKTSPPDIDSGINAITCFLHACRHQNESKSRKYLAKVLWLLTYDDAKFSLTEAVEKYVSGVPPGHWLPWIPQLLTGLMRSEGKFLLNLLSQVGRIFPQAVYFPIRTLYLTLKIEQMERYKSAEKSQGNQAKSSSEQVQGQLRATSSMWRCSRIMQMQRDMHPTVISSLEGFVDQMVWFRESWHEEVLRQLRQGLAKCYLIAFDNRGAVSEATITPHTLQFVKKLVSTFGIGLENIGSSVNSSLTSAASESIARRAEVTIQDPVFQKIKGQFSADFDFSVPGAMKLQNLIIKLKKWIKILEKEIKLMPKSFLIEEKCRFLSNFSPQTAEIELPGEFLLPKHSHYFVKISRFMPRVEIVQKHNTAARRLFIRGHNGKIYPYLVINDSGLGDARREERVLQLLRMINHYLAKQKETARRFLNITVPRVVAVSPQMRLVEDNPASISLLDIYKKSCEMLKVEHDAPITKYYDRLAIVQSRGLQASHQILKDILKEIQNNMIPKGMLRDWALRTFATPTDFWTFRKMFTLQLSLACFCEYVLHLTRLNPDMMYVHQDSGLLNVAYFKFDVDETKGELDANRAVPFRLTPNILELVSELGVSGPLTSSIVAAARCCTYPNFKMTSILKAILRDEMIFAHKKVNKKLEEQQQHENMGSPPAEVAGEVIVSMVTNAVNSINQRLNSLANFDVTESKVSTLVAAAKYPDNLCRMDPAWHPWL